MVEIVSLDDMGLHIRARGQSTSHAPDFSGEPVDGVITFDPGLDGMLAGQGTMSGESDHRGERHLDGDEILYVAEGRLHLLLETASGIETHTANAGQAIIVPQGLWHRLRGENAKFLYIGGGKTEIRIE